jgi:hypothetical protein
MIFRQFVILSLQIEKLTGSCSSIIRVSLMESVISGVDALSCISDGGPPLWKRAARRSLFYIDSLCRVHLAFRCLVFRQFNSLVGKFLIFLAIHNSIWYLLTTTPSNHKLISRYVHYLKEFMMRFKQIKARTLKVICSLSNKYYNLKLNSVYRMRLWIALLNSYEPRKLSWYWAKSIIFQINPYNGWLLLM